MNDRNVSGCSADVRNKEHITEGRVTDSAHLAGRAGDRRHITSTRRCGFGAARPQCHTRPGTRGGTPVATVHGRLTRADGSSSAGIRAVVTLHRMGGGIMKHLNLEVEQLED